MPETSIAQQLMINSLSMNSQIMQGTFSALSNIGNLSNNNNVFDTANYTVTNSLGKLAYAVEGDSKYDEKYDTNGDGIVTYNEYIKYITDSMMSKYNIPQSNTVFQNGIDSLTGLNKFTVTNIGRVLSSYLNNYAQLPTGIIEQEV